MNATEYLEVPFKIKTFDTDFNQKLRLDTLAFYLQECAEMHATTGDIGYEGMIKNNIFWVLSKLQIEIEELPKIHDEIIIKTWSKGIFKLFAIRDFIVYKNGKPIIKASTNWLIVNSETRRPARPIEYFNNFPFYNQESLPVNLDRVKFNGELIEELDKRKVRYSDLDVNKHANNTKYISWIMDSFDTEWHQKTLKSIEIDYVHETMINEEFLIKSDQEKKSVQIKLLNDKILANAKLEF